MPRCEECLHFELCEALELGNGIMKVHPIHCGFYKPAADVAPKSEAIKEYLAKVLEKKDIAGHYVPDYDVVSVSVLEYYAKEFAEGKRDV